jgi:hypothetical protein
MFEVIICDMSVKSHGGTDTMTKYTEKAHEKLAFQLLFLCIYAALSKIMWLLTLG